MNCMQALYANSACKSACMDFDPVGAGSANHLTPDFSKVRVLVRHDGSVHWEPGGIFTTTCDINIRYFPFDDQACSIQFGAWAYYSARMNITSVSTRVQTRDFRLNGEWDVYRSKVRV